MKLLIVTDAGTQLAEIEALATYNLEQPTGRARLLEDLQAAIRSGAKTADREGEYVPTWSEPAVMPTLSGRFPSPTEEMKGDDVLSRFADAHGNIELIPVEGKEEVQNG